VTELAVTDRGPGSDGTQWAESGTESEKFLATAVKRFRRADEWENENRISAVDDIKFRSGDQWPEDIKAQRTLEKRPCLTINKMGSFVHQITNDQRQNRPAINISPVGDDADKQTALMLKGLIKQIERQCDAEIAYDTAFDSAVTMGWGYWRIIAEYDGPASFDQKLVVEMIDNPFRVYLDPDARRPDGSDAKWGFISDLMPNEEFDAEYGVEKRTPWNPQGMGEEHALWTTQTHTRVAEYYCIKTKQKRLVALDNGWTGLWDDLADVVKEAYDTRPEGIVNERITDVPVVHWSKITDHAILEEMDLPGKYIPIVRVIGDKNVIEGRVVYAGMVRAAKDPQRMYNYWTTSETEMIALSPKAPWIMEEGQVEGHEGRWRTANLKSYPYLLYKGSTIGGKQVPPPQRQTFDGPPLALVNAKQGAAQDMQAVTGVRFDATLNERMYDESGQALRELKRVGDLANFHFIDNLARALRQTGRIFVDLIPKYYDTRRVLTILREDESEEQAIIDPRLPQAYREDRDEQGSVMRLYNPNLGKYEVAVTIGPSYATRRQEAADTLLKFVSAFPPAAQVAGDLIASNMDWPGAEEIAARLQTLLPPGLQAKELEDLPVEARGLVAQLMQQNQQTTKQLQQAAAMLGDKEADRALERQKLEVQQGKVAMDYDAKIKALEASMQEVLVKIMSEGQENTEAAMAKVMADFEAKMTATILDNELKRQQVDNDLWLSEEELAMKERQGGEGKGSSKSGSDSSGGIVINLGGNGGARKGKKVIRKKGDGKYELVERTPEVTTPAAEKVLRTVTKAANGDMEVEDMGDDD
jgi:hypothetical protein